MTDGAHLINRRHKRRQPGPSARPSFGRAGACGPWRRRRRQLSLREVQQQVVDGAHGRLAATRGKGQGAACWRRRLRLLCRPRHHCACGLPRQRSKPKHSCRAPMSSRAGGGAHGCVRCGESCWACAASPMSASASVALSSASTASGEPLPAVAPRTSMSGEGAGSGATYVRPCGTRRSETHRGRHPSLPSRCQPPPPPPPPPPTPARCSRLQCPRQRPQRQPTAPHPPAHRGHSAPRLHPASPAPRRHQPLPRPAGRRWR